jgi:hypothetical protein
MQSNDYELKLKLNDVEHSIGLPTHGDEINVTAILEIACYLFKKMGAKIMYEPFSNEQD